MAATIDESNACILHALRGNPKALSLDNCHLNHLPAAVVRLKSLKTLSAKNNQLCDAHSTAEILNNFPQVMISHCSEFAVLMAIFNI